eukprot:4332966-Alexandrium_andersonii.AAC.1
MEVSDFRRFGAARRTVRPRAHVDQTPKWPARCSDLGGPPAARATACLRPRRRRTPPASPAPGETQALPGETSTRGARG